MSASPATVAHRGDEDISPPSAATGTPPAAGVWTTLRQSGQHSSSVGRGAAAMGPDESSPLTLGGRTTTGPPGYRPGGTPRPSTPSAGPRVSTHRGGPAQLPTVAEATTTTAASNYRDSLTDWASWTPLHGRGSLSASSVAAAGVTGTLTQTESAAATTVSYSSSSSPYDNFKLGLIVTLSVVIGCFAITAISLRIRSRMKKRRLESETTKKRKKCTANNTKPPVKRVTVRTRGNSVPPQDKGAQGSKPVRRSHSPSLQSRARVSKVKFTDNMDRNRTLDALLLDAGVYPTSRAPSPPMGPFTSRPDRTGSDASSRSSLLPRADSALCGPAEHAYTNPAVSLVEEGALIRADAPGPPTPVTAGAGTTLRVQAEVHRGKGAPSRQHPPPAAASDSDDGSAAECKGHCACVENSETESLVDARRRSKLGQYHGMRSNQRNDSKDSGYVESFISQDSLRLRAMTSLEENHPLPVRGGLYALGAGGGGGGRALAACRGGSPDELPVTHLTLNRSSSVKSENDGCMQQQRVWLDGVVEAARRPRLSVPAFPTHHHQHHQHRNHQLQQQQQQQQQPPASQWHQHCQPGSAAAVQQGPYYELQPFGMRRYPSSEGSTHELVLLPHYQPGVVSWAPHRKISQDIGRRSPQSPRFEAASSTPAGGLDHRDYATPTARHSRGAPAKRFVKQRSLGTQTREGDVCGIPSAVCWNYNSAGNLVALPLEGADMDFMGPVYMAEELEMSTCIPTDMDCVIEMSTFT